MKSVMKNSAHKSQITLIANYKVMYLKLRTLSLSFIYKLKEV